jgi:hypothetical protein
LSLGVPEILQGVREQLGDFQVSIKDKEEAVVGFTNLRQVNVRTDVLRASTLNKPCLSAIAGRDIVMIRGIIYGSEVVSSRRALNADAKLVVLNSEACLLNMTRQEATR